MKRILIIIILCAMVCGCMAKPYQVRLHQEISNVVGIELLDTSGDNTVVLYVLDQTEFQNFWDKLHTLSFLRYYNDPSTEYGPLSIRIQYSNGYVDIIGCDINGYYSPDGNNEAQDGWYCIENRNDFVVLFAQYIDKADLPIID